MTSSYIIAKLKKLGFICLHQKGSHKQFKKGALRVTVADHGNKTMNVKTVLSIIQQANISRQELESN